MNLLQNHIPNSLNMYPKLHYMKWRVLQELHVLKNTKYQTQYLFLTQAEINTFSSPIY